MVKKEKQALPEGALETVEESGGISEIYRALPEEETAILLKDIYHACSDIYRIKILFMLTKQPLCVCIIREVLDISDSRLSYHLKILQKAGLISGTSKGTWIIYELTKKGRFFSDLNIKISGKV
ncbi:winged helix-turn-helix transcriptional regulator [Methanoplanus sp. FWC-SCC4]|uniref:Winged helix-turn-helix transcriptional regulator n=1 Tax=Methanochimaera problematica TaxID=2609417 RepID=A0AA97FF22_9EURY|nr:metalloregulator ArsR/SmtB family transcription factor [Methanoplanus sp. FWC-SCC4]WOF17103.1 winged helix-turn-helix transcriptional regulator [Methanoplanus sp. FWC-SCC4]